MKKITKKLMLLLLAGIILFQTNGINTHLNNNSSDNTAVSPCNMDEELGNGHTEF